MIANTGWWLKKGVKEMRGQAVLAAGKCVALAQAEEVVRLTAPGAEVGPRHCVWMERGLVAYRLCTRRHECARCAFGQAVQEAGW